MAETFMLTAAASTERQLYTFKLTRPGDAINKRSAGPVLKPLQKSYLHCFAQTEKPSEWLFNSRKLYRKRLLCFLYTTNASHAVHDIRPATEE